ncbi:MAG: hypothetical protein J6R77_02615 [Clostridia bacterium]|nr:hypothetical protein [Clostridia bacterium]
MYATIIHKQTLQHTGLLLGVGVACWALLRWPVAAANGVSRGLAVCGEVIIPSLFPFLVLTGVFVRSGLAGRVGKRLERLTRRLFRLPGCCGAAMLVGMIGGYPAGAVAVRDLLERGEITKKQAKRLLGFCVGGGPAFIIGAVGTRLLGSTYKGILLYIAHLLAALLIGLFARGRGEDFGIEKSQLVSKSETLSKAFVQAVGSGCSALLSMCGFVMTFSAFLSLSDASGLTGVMSYPFTLVGGQWGLPALYTAFWEVSCGSVAVAGSMAEGAGLAFLLGATLGWGGVSVHCQIGGILSEYGLPGKDYWLARGWHALLGGGLSALLFRFLPMPADRVVATVGSPSAFPAVRPVSVSVAASVTMLLLCGVFLLTASRKNENRDLHF